MHRTVAPHPVRETLSIEELARTLGINRSTAYELARQDKLPVPVIRLGKRMLVSRRALNTLLSRQHTANLEHSESTS
jgi:excisionase family DNA binding protein